MCLGSIFNNYIKTIKDILLSIFILAIFSFDRAVLVGKRVLVRMHHGTTAEHKGLYATDSQSAHVERRTK